MNNKLSDKIEAVKRRFLASLSEREQQLDMAWQQLQTRRWDGETLAPLQLLAHRLAGNSALFGLPELGTLARELDQCLDELPDGEQPDQRERVAERVARLRAALLRPSEMPTAAAVPPPAPAGSDRPLLFLVDDDTDLTALLALQLEASGYRVSAFAAPEASLAALAETTPAVVLMDIAFPEGSLAGIEAVSAIRARSGERIPVLFLSARADLDARVRALRAGGYAFLAKPFALTELLATIAMAIEEARQRPLRVLVVDDDAQTALFHATLLESMQFQAQALTDPNQLFEQLERFRPDVLLLDLLMPGFSGDELATLVIESELDWGCAVLMLSAHDSDAVRARALAFGAHGFIAKPASAQVLAEHVRGAARAARRRAARVRRVTQHASRSAILHRAEFLARLDQLLAAPGHAAPTLLYLGIDQSESIVRQHGRWALVGLQTQLLALADVVAQPGEDWSALGDSLLTVLLRDSEHAADRAEQLRAAIQAAKFQLGERTVHCSSSVAVLHLGADLPSAAAALAWAERGEREARLAGGNRVVVVASADAKTPARRELDIDAVLAQAALGLQPIVSLEADQPSLFDALLRLREGGELRAAQQFLPQLLTAGHGARLDQRVLALAQQYHAGGISAPIAIRLSRASLDDPAALRGLLASCASATSLLVQLDEDWIALQPEAAAAITALLRERGIGCLLSGFGRSRSPDLVQRCGPFAYARLGDSVPEEAIGGLLAAAEQAGCRVIASHVEDAKRLAQLWKLGVRLFQGNFIEQPNLRAA